MKSASSVLDEAAFLPLLELVEQQNRKEEPECACDHATENIARIMDAKVDTANCNHAEHENRKEYQGDSSCR